MFLSMLSSGVSLCRMRVRTALICSMVVQAPATDTVLLVLLLWSPH